MYLIYAQNHNVFSTALWAEDPFASNGSHGCQGRCFTIAGAADFWEVQGTSQWQMMMMMMMMMMMKTSSITMMYRNVCRMYPLVCIYEMSSVWLSTQFAHDLHPLCIDLTLNLWEIECVFGRYWSSRRSAVHGNVESVVWQELEASYATMIRASIFKVKWHETVQNSFLVGREQTFGWTVAGGQWLT